jgi:hypothetical protein
LPSHLRQAWKPRRKPWPLQEGQRIGVTGKRPPPACSNRLRP